jgi:uncharacterized membrane protein
MSKKSNQPRKVPRSQTKTTVQIAEQRTTVSGPIPSADELARYNAIDPELVNRIVSLAEREATNRHKMESLALNANIGISDKQFSERRLGQRFGFGIGALGLISSVILAWIGAENTASIVGGSTVLGLVGIFVTGQILSKKDNSAS